MTHKKESKFISIVVYMRNESEYIYPFFDTVLKGCADNFETYEIICVNDGSIDGSAERLREYFDAKKEHTIISIIQMSYFQGLEASMNAGRDLAIGDFIFEFDDMNADYSSDLLGQIYEKMLEGYDIVSACSNGKIKLTSRIFYGLFNMTSHSNSRIGQETFRILSRRAVNRVKSIGTYIPYRKAVYMNCGLKTTTIPYKSTRKTSRLHSKTNRNERTSLAADSFIYFTDVLEKVALFISGAFLLFSLGVVIYIVSSIFASSKPVEGWVSTMGFLAFGFFGVFVLLTIILKYLSVLLNLIFRHQRYLIEGIEKISNQ